MAFVLHGFSGILVAFPTTPPRMESGAEIIVHRQKIAAIVPNGAADDEF